MRQKFHHIIHPVRTSHSIAKGPKAPTSSGTLYTLVRKKPTAPDHHGAVNVDQVHWGQVFSMTLSATTDAYPPHARAARPAETLHILVVDADRTMHGHYDAILHRAGLGLLGPAKNEREVRQLLKSQKADAAILDVDSSDSDIWKIADLLHARGTCFVLTSEAPLDSEMIPAPHQDAVRLTKPFTREQLLMGLRLVCEAFH